MSQALSPGDFAPAFLTEAIGGKYPEAKKVSLADFCGQNLVLYFYPKDDTPGCTAQACGLRDAWAEFAHQAAVFGVSVDSVKSHEKFLAKYTLPFPCSAIRSTRW